MSAGSALAQPLPKVSTSVRPSARVLDSSVSMARNINHSRTSGMTLVMLLTSALSVAAQGRERCAAATDSVTAGWHAYRHDSLAAAAGYFTIAERFCPASLDAANGLAFVSLRRAELGRADSLFRAVIGRDSVNADAWDGLARTAQRRRDIEGMRAAGHRGADVESGQRRFARISGWRRPGLEPGAPRASGTPCVPPRCNSGQRTKGDRFESGPIADGVHCTCKA